MYNGIWFWIIIFFKFIFWNFYFGIIMLVIIYFILSQNPMKKLIKDKNFFQITCEKKSIIEIKSDDNETIWLQIEWYASTKDKDRWKDIVEPSAFKSALDLYMTNPIILLQHNADKPIWTVTEASIDDKWLYIKANITENEDWIFSKLKNWVIRAFSIWYRVKDFEDEAIKDDNWVVTSIETVIKDLELFEISLVSIPMNPYALTKSMESCFEETEEEEKTDENSEIDDSNEQEISENSTENVELDNETDIEEKTVKELSMISMESFFNSKAEMLKKSFSEELSKKDSEIKSLKETLSKATDILEKFANCLDEIDNKMSNTIIQSGFAYQTPVKKKNGYSNLINQIKNF